MDILKRDELFEKLNKNKDDYRKFIKKNEAFEAECHKFFVNNNVKISDKDYIDIYVKRSKELYKEKQELDSEWEMLKKELYKLMCANYNE